MCQNTDQHHQLRGQSVQIAQEDAVGDDESQIFHVPIGLGHGGVVIKHQQDASDRQHDEKQKGNRAKIVRRPHAQRFLAHFDRQKVQEQVAEYRQAAGAVGERRAAAEYGFPDAGFAQTVQTPLDEDVVAIVSLRLSKPGWRSTISSLSTNNSPSAVSEIAKCGSGAGAGPRLCAIATGTCCRGRGRRSACRPASTA